MLLSIVTQHFYSAVSLSSSLSSLLRRSLSSSLSSVTQQCYSAVNLAVHIAVQTAVSLSSVTQHFTYSSSLSSSLRRSLRSSLSSVTQQCYLAVSAATEVRRPSINMTERPVGTYISCLWICFEVYNPPICSDSHAHKVIRTPLHSIAYLKQ